MTRSQRTKWRIPNSRPWITGDDTLAVMRAVNESGTGELQLGSEVAAFEHELAEFLGRKYVVCVSSGTVALELAYRSAGVPHNHQGAFGFIATANAKHRACGDILFNDSPSECLLGDVSREGYVPSGVRDACQAFGAKLPPSLADCYSGNWNKPVTCLGGGWVATDDEWTASHVRAMANQGRMGDGWAQCLGTNARMSDMQAALGRSQLRRVGEILERRRQVADHYLGSLPSALMLEVADRESWFLFPVELSNRDEVHAKMRERGIETRSCADWALHLHPYYAQKYNHKRGDFPEAERRADRTLLLPLYPEMTLEQVQEVCKALEECDARS